MISAIGLLVIQTLGAVEYYNNRTITGSVTINDKVYIGSKEAEGGASAAANALVTVAYGATWLNTDDVFVGYYEGVSRRFIEDSGNLYVTNAGSKVLRVGRSDKAVGVVTNMGYIMADKLYVGDKDYCKKACRVDNYGTISILKEFSLGERKDGVGETALFHNHAGATLNMLRDVNGQYAFYIGSRSPAVLTNEGEIVFNPASHLVIGGANTSTGYGRLVMSENGSIVPGNTVRIGFRSGGARGCVELNDNSTFINNNAICELGFGAISGKFAASGAASGEIILSGNSQFSVKGIEMGCGTGSTAKVTLKDNSTLAFESENFEVAKNCLSTGCVELLNFRKTSFSKNLHLGIGEKSVGTFRLDGTSVLNYSKEFRLGCASGAIGCIELDGESSLTVAKLNVEGYLEGATGIVSVAGNSRLTVPGELRIGSANGKYGRFEVSGTSVAMISNVVIAAVKGVNNQLGVLRVFDSGAVSNVHEMLMGRSTTAHGFSEMRGGKILFNSTAASPGTSLTVGINGDSAAGFISGWGFVGFDNATAIMRDYQSLGRTTWGGLYLYGKITADGMGINRDLDFSRAGVCVNQNYGKNVCGTNGWYATNKGRLLMPRSLHRATKAHATIGDYPTLSDPRLVNSFRYDFDKNTMDKTGAYVFSELYATDRSDIPAGLPTGKGIHHSAVWRIGHFNASATPDVDDEDLTTDHKQNFSSLKLKFHYDPALAEIEDVRHVKVYRHDGTANGSWRCVASTAPSAETPYVETANFTPSSALWNAGWFAVVGTPRVGTVMVIR
jgi:hypothetical protein